MEELEAYMKSAKIKYCGYKEIWKGSNNECADTTGAQIKKLKRDSGFNQSISNQ